MYGCSKKTIYFLVLSLSLLFNSCSPSYSAAGLVKSTSTVNHWEGFTSQQGDFRVSFPEEPQESSHSKNHSMQGHAFFLRGKKFISLSKEFGHCSLETFDYNKRPYSSNERYIIHFSKVANGILSNAANGVMKMHPSVDFLDVRPGIQSAFAEYSYSENERIYFGYIQVNEGKLYMLNYQSNPNEKYDVAREKAKKFWSSFQLTDGEGSLLNLPEKEEKELRYI
jgi:hypothetical protein